MFPKLCSSGLESQQYEHVLRADFIAFLVSAEVKETEEEAAAKEKQIEEELKDFEEEEDEEALAERCEL